jgi:hypothetical protein
MYNDDYRDYDSLDEFVEFDELDEFRDESPDEDEFVEFVPPYGCPYYRQFFPGGGSTPPRPPRAQFQPPRPPFGPPGGPQGPQGGPQGGAPSGPPPSFTPSIAQAQSFGAPGGVGTYAVDPGAIRPCRFRFVYIWLRGGNSFWAWLTFVGPRSVSGFRWNGRRWVYFGIDIRRIRSFICY